MANLWINNKVLLKLIILEMKADDHINLQFKSAKNWKYVLKKKKQNKTTKKKEKIDSSGGSRSPDLWCVVCV